MTFSLSACSPEANDVLTFKMFNDTEHNVKLLSFDNSIKRKIDEISITPNSVFTTKKERGNVGNFLGEAFYSSSSVDSIRLIFNSNRVIIFLNTAENHNIFYGNMNREFHITNEDYAKSISCTNDCE